MLSDNQKDKLKKSFVDGNLRVRSVSPYGDLEWKRITKVHRADVRPESIWRITTESGVSVVTGGHRLFINPSPNDAKDTELFVAGDRVLSVLNEQLGYARLLEVAQIEDRKWMYDVTVEDNHNLILEKSKICVKNSPDRNYHFRPPAHEETIQQFNRVFGYIWEDVELQEYLFRGLDMIIASPPRTPFATIDQMVQSRPEWRTLLLTGAMIYALQALKINWTEEEFSVVGEQEVRVWIQRPGKVNMAEDVKIEELFAMRTAEYHTFNPLKQKIQQELLAGRLLVKACWDGTLKPIFAPIADVLRHESSHKPLVRLGISQDRFVTCTMDHSVYTLDPNNMPRGVWAVPASHLKQGDVIVHLKPTMKNKVGYRVVRTVDPVAPREFTYDLSVPGPQNFFLANGTLAHNSYSIGGVSLDLDKSSKYEAAQQAASDQFEKQLEKAKQTVNIVKGLQQPKYSHGVRSAFGPYVGAGVSSPRKFIGF